MSFFTEFFIDNLERSNTTPRNTETEQPTGNCSSNASASSNNSDLSISSPNGLHKLSTSTEGDIDEYDPLEVFSQSLPMTYSLGESSDLNGIRHPSTSMVLISGSSNQAQQSASDIARMENSLDDDIFDIMNIGDQDKPMTLNNCRSEETTVAGFSISDKNLMTMSINELNKVVRQLPQKEITRIKQRRRTLKNRHYAQACRQRQFSAHEGLQTKTQILETRITSLEDELKRLQEERYQYKETFEKLLELPSLQHLIPNTLRRQFSKED